MGIIALFASLAEVSGTVVLRFLPERIQFIFIWFVILFPIIIVLLFFYILYKKPLHFYSPEYYQNETNFMASMADVIDNQQQIIGIVDVMNEALPQEVRNQIQERVQQVEENLEEIQAGSGEAKNGITLKVNGTEISAATVKSFYRKVFEYLDMNDISYDQLVPYATGNKRYLINRENRHIAGGEFVAPIVVDGYYIETHKSKAAARSDIMKFLKELKLRVE